MTAGVYPKTDLTPAAQAKARSAWAVTDLPAGPLRTEAQSRDVVAIVEGTTVTILAPTGSLSAALRVVKVEREAKGI